MKDDQLIIHERFQGKSPEYFLNQNSVSKEMLQYLVKRKLYASYSEEVVRISRDNFFELQKAIMND